ncbi:MAG TPA: SRPBCC domain-containing protein [Saprospiraceae bacterium]|nr:SRPBCC domain-containing protein [Saprospiraceae bacterium]
MWITMLLIALLVLALLFTKFEIRHDIIIQAEPSKVWNSIIDFPNYKAWNSQLSYLGGIVQPKSVIHLKLSVANTTPYEFKPVISHWEENRRFAWLATTIMPRLFDGEHFFELSDLGNGSTLLTNREEYRGVISLIMKSLPMMKEAPKGFEKMNIELKNHIEKQP